jgi:transcriptional regulator with XRE-family HTH domain
MNANTGRLSLREQRKAHGLSQQRLADLANCSIDMVRRLEHGYQPTHQSAVLARVEAALRDAAAARNGGPSEHETPVAGAPRVETAAGSRGATTG